MEFLPLSRPTARAALRGDGAHPDLTGEVFFFSYGRGTLVIARVMGLPAPGFFGFHVHETGNCASGGDIPFAQAGGHYDPHHVPHPWHSGDLPPLLADAQGAALSAIYTDRFTPGEVIGRAIVIHSAPDDFRTQPGGDSGERIACGVILVYA